MVEQFHRSSLHIAGMIRKGLVAMVEFNCVITFPRLGASMIVGAEWCCHLGMCKASIALRTWTK